MEDRKRRKEGNVGEKEKEMCVCVSFVGWTIIFLLLFMYMYYQTLHFSTLPPSLPPSLASSSCPSEGHSVCVRDARGRRRLSPPLLSSYFPQLLYCT